jgi:hypothetical protein
VAMRVRAGRPFDGLSGRRPWHSDDRAQLWRSDGLERDVAEDRDEEGGEQENCVHRHDLRFVAA